MVSFLRLLTIAVYSVVVLVGAAPTAVAVQASEKDTLVDKIIGAYGDRQQVLSVQSYRMEARLRARARGEQAEVVRVAEGASRLKIFIGYPASTEIRVLNGEQAWRGRTPHDLVSVQGPLRGAMVLQSARAALPWILEELKKQTRIADSPDGAPVLEISLGGGLKVLAFVDPNTHRIVRSEGALRIGDAEMRFKTEYSDFRKVDGVLFAFHEENYASGTHTGTTIVKSIRLNPTGSALQLPVK